MKNTKLSLSLPRLDHFLHKSRLLFNAKNCSRRPVKWIKNSSFKIYSNLLQNPFKILHDLEKKNIFFPKSTKQTNDHKNGKYPKIKNLTKSKI